jgi:hypothetical protein
MTNSDSNNVAKTGTQDLGNGKVHLPDIEAARKAVLAAIDARGKAQVKLDLANIPRRHVRNRKTTTETSVTNMDRFSGGTDDAGWSVDDDTDVTSQPGSASTAGASTMSGATGASADPSIPQTGA